MSSIKDILEYISLKDKKHQKNKVLPQKLECNMRDQHVEFFYALTLINRLIGDWGIGISPQTADYVRIEVKKALGKL